MLLTVQLTEPEIRRSRGGNPTDSRRRRSGIGGFLSFKSTRKKKYYSNYNRWENLLSRIVSNINPNISKNLSEINKETKIIFIQSVFDRMRSTSEAFLTASKNVCKQTTLSRIRNEIKQN